MTSLSTPSREPSLPCLQDYLSEVERAFRGEEKEEKNFDDKEESGPVRGSDYDDDSSTEKELPIVADREEEFPNNREELYDPDIEEHQIEDGRRDMNEFYGCESFNTLDCAPLRNELMLSPTSMDSDNEEDHSINSLVGTQTEHKKEGNVVNQDNERRGTQLGSRTFNSPVTMTVTNISNRKITPSELPLNVFPKRRFTHDSDPIVTPLKSVSERGLSNQSPHENDDSSSLHRSRSCGKLQIDSSLLTLPEVDKILHTTHLRKVVSHLQRTIRDFRSERDSALIKSQSAQQENVTLKQSLKDQEGIIEELNDDINYMEEFIQHELEKIKLEHNLQNQGNEAIIAHLKENLENFEKKNFDNQSELRAMKHKVEMTNIEKQQVEMQLDTISTSLQLDGVASDHSLKQFLEKERERSSMLEKKLYQLTKEEEMAMMAVETSEKVAREAVEKKEDVEKQLMATKELLESMKLELDNMKVENEELRKLVDSQKDELLGKKVAFPQSHAAQQEKGDNHSRQDVSLMSDENEESEFQFQSTENSFERKYTEETLSLDHSLQTHKSDAIIGSQEHSQVSNQETAKVRKQDDMINSSKSNQCKNQFMVLEKKLRRASRTAAASFMKEELFEDVYDVDIDVAQGVCQEMGSESDDAESCQSEKELVVTKAKMNEILEEQKIFAQQVTDAQGAFDDLKVLLQQRGGIEEHLAEIEVGSELSQCKEEVAFLRQSLIAMRRPSQQELMDRKKVMKSSSERQLLTAMEFQNLKVENELLKMELRKFKRFKRALPTEIQTRKPFANVCNFFTTNSGRARWLESIKNTLGRAFSYLGKREEENVVTVGPKGIRFGRRNNEHAKNN